MPDVVITLGREPRVDEIPGTRFENWDTDKPFDGGTDGMPQIRLVRDDIAARVKRLAVELTGGT